MVGDGVMRLWNTGLPRRYASIGSVGAITELRPDYGRPSRSGRRSEHYHDSCDLFEGTAHGLQHVCKKGGVVDRSVGRQAARTGNCTPSLMRTAAR
jgi:hypothetical protein